MVLSPESGPLPWGDGAQSWIGTLCPRVMVLSSESGPLPRVVALGPASAGSFPARLEGGGPRSATPLWTGRQGQI